MKNNEIRMKFKFWMSLKVGVLIKYWLSTMTSPKIQIINNDEPWNISMCMYQPTIILTLDEYDLDVGWISTNMNFEQ